MRRTRLYLKRITLQGFKSFADPVTLDLAPGITAVVGPNGSGKSNVVEAVRWVLGEQSARRLRGYRMDDLIFAGSRKRRPVNLAEVTLVIEDEDGRLGSEYSEVSLTRRVDREGTAEFFINRSPCRLRDIQELFFDTGLGRASYALIGQGELEVVITGRPEDRGAMVEEVAGLTRVRERISLVRRRVSRLEPSRGRLADRLSDMEGRLEPLRIQAQRARKHEDLSGQLRSLERSLQLHRLAGLSTDARSKEAGRGRLREQLERERASLAGDRETIAAARKGLEEATAELEDARRAAGREQSRLQEALHRVRSAEARLETLAAEQDRIRQELDLSWSRWLDLRARRRDGMDEEAQLAATADEMAGELSALEERVSSLGTELAAHPAGPDEETASCRQKLRETDQAAGRAAQQVTSGEESMVVLARRLEDLSRLADRALRDERRVAGDLEQVETELVETRTGIAEAESELADVVTALDENRAQQATLDRDRAGTLARLEALAEMERLGAGYGEGTRFLLGLDRDDLTEARPGIIGALGQVVKPRPGCEAALEAVLESTASDLLVESAHAAREAIGTLKEADAGRATFWFGGARGRDRSIPRECLTLPGFAGVGRDLVDPNCPGAELAAALLDDVVVFEQLDQVPDSDALEKWGVRAATLDGDMAFAGGMRGGSRGQGAWTRRRDVHRLGERLSGLKARLEELARTEQELEQRQESLTGALARLRSSEQALGVKRHLYCQQVEESAARLKDSRRQRTEAMAELDRLKAEVAAAHEGLAEATAARADLEDRIRQLEETRATREEMRRQLASRLEEARDRASRVKVDLESRRGRLEVRRSWNDGLTRDMVDLARSRRELGERLLKAESERRARGDDLDQFRQQVQTLKESVVEHGERVNRNEAAVRSRESEVFRLEAGLGASEERLARIDGRLHREELALARVATELSGARQLLSERGVPEDEMESATLLDDPDGATARASALREEITAMGVVNPLAVEEYARLEDRHGKLNTAVSDIDSAASDVEWIRAHLERAMRRVFMDVLGEVDARFLRAFERLFGGGEARLILAEDGEDDQVPGIEVVAQPPGKKLQHLSLLSGGERALTATAFLFALLDFLPAPFVIFDEIDAALDELNVTRFSEYLRELSDRAQVIIVTHQRGTMERVDMLYGTTMDDSGVTQVVPVRLSEIEAEQA